MSKIFNIKERCRLWKIWSKWHVGGTIYKLLVLFGLMVSPTFEMMPEINDYERRINE